MGKGLTTLLGGWALGRAESHPGKSEPTRGSDSLHKWRSAWTECAVPSRCASLGPT